MNEWPEDFGDPRLIYDFTRLSEFPNAPTGDFAFMGFYPIDDDYIVGGWSRLFGGGVLVTPLGDAKRELVQAAQELEEYDGTPPAGYREAARFVMNVDAVEYTSSAGFTRQFGKIVFDTSSGEYVVLIPMDSGRIKKLAEEEEDDIPF